MPEEHAVVKLGERFESLVLALPFNLEHLHQLEVVLIVSSTMGVLNVVT